MTFKEAVNCYCCLLCKEHLDELDDVKSLYMIYSSAPSPTSLHNLATACVVGDHQHRISSKSKTNAINVIKSRLPSILLTTFTDYEDLYNTIDHFIGSIPQIGPLTIYDISLRIGHLFIKPIYPQKILYLNSGAMEGAKKLLGGRKLRHKEDFNVFFSYPEAKAVVGINSLQSLPNNLVEDFFCVMKDYLDLGPRGLIGDRDRTPTYLGM